MQHEVKKISRIVDELTTFFLKEDTNEIEFKIKREIDRTIIDIVDYNTHFDEDSIREISEILNVQRQIEIEAYYWQLAGETDSGEELLLIGTMIDQAIVKKENGNLIIKLIRKIISR